MERNPYIAHSWLGRGSGWLWAGVLAGAVGLLSPNLPAQTPPAQPNEPAKEQRPQQAGGRNRADRDFLRSLMSLPPEERRAKLRAFLVERLERADKAREALIKAISAVDSGTSLEDIGALIPPEIREFRGGGGWWMGGMPAPTEQATVSPSDDELGPVRLPGMGGPGGAGGPGGPGGAGSPGGRAGPPEAKFEGPLTDEDRAVVNEFLLSAAPPLHGMLKELRERSPEKADQKTRETLSRIGWLVDLRKKDRATYDLRLQDVRYGREAFDAARALAAYDRSHPGQDQSADREKLVIRVREALGEQFRVRGELNRREIARIEADLTQRRADMAKRDETKDATIQRMMEKLTDRASEWMKRRPHEPGNGPGGPPGGKGRDDRPKRGGNGAPPQAGEPERADSKP